MHQDTPQRWHPVGLSGGGGTETPAISPHDPRFMLLNCDMSGAYRSTDGGANWHMLPWRELTGCPFCAPVWHARDPAVVYAAHSYAATLRRSADGGATWAPFGRGLPGDLRQLATDPGDAARLWAGTVNGLYYSHDEGVTWTAATGWPGEALGIHADQTSPATTRRCFAATSAGVWRSDDGGASWTPTAGRWPAARVAGFAGASDAATGVCALYAWVVGPATPGAATCPGMLHRSLDGGATWPAVATLPIPAAYAGGGLCALLASNRRPRTVYAVQPAYSAADTVRRSDDGGENFRPVLFADKSDARYNLADNYITAYFLPRSLWSWTMTAAAINPADPEHLLVSHYCSVFITRDGGTTWQAGETRLAPGQAPRPNDRARWISNGLTNTTTWHYHRNPHDARRRYIAYTDLGLATSADGGATWRWDRNLGSNVYELAFDPAVPGRVWAALAMVHDIPNNNIVLVDHDFQGPGCLAYSEDFGEHWAGRIAGLPGAPSGREYDCSGMPGLPALVTSVALDPRSPPAARTLYAAVWEHGVYYSTDGGRQWAPVGPGLGAPGANVRVCRVQIHADGTLYALVTGRRRGTELAAAGVGLYRWAPGAGRWTCLTAALDLRWPTDFTLDPRDSRVVLLGACDTYNRAPPDGGLYRTRDGGGSWERLVRFGSRHFGATRHPERPDWVYLTLNYNDAATPPLWLSRDDGRTWTPFRDYPFCSAHRVHFDADEPAVIYVTGYGGGVWRGPAEP